MTAPSANGRLQIGLVGAGMVGQLHAQAIGLVPGLKLVALADLRPELRRRVADAHRIPRTYPTHLELLSDPAIDAVAVVVRREATSAVVRDCLTAGRHVYSEKPMAMTAGTAAELADLAHRQGLFYTVGFQKRHDPGTARCREVLARLQQTGELGRLTFVRGWNHTGQDREPDAGLIMTDEARPSGLAVDPVTPAWLPRDHARSYDRFVNAYCHDVNALHDFFPGTPQVRAAELGVFGGQSLILGYEKFIVSMGFTLSEMVDWSRRGEWDEGFEFHFEAGRLLIEFPPPLYRARAARVLLRRGAAAAEVVWDGTSPVPVFALQAQDFLDDLRDGRVSCSAGSLCVPDMALIDRIWAKGVGDDRHDGSAAFDTALPSPPGCPGPGAYRPS